MIACPNCGFSQPASAKCVKCSSLFAYYPGTPEGRLPSPTLTERSPALPTKEWASEDDKPSFKERFALAFKIYRIFRWASLIAAGLTILMILRKSPPPIMPAPDRAAAARAAEKFSEAQTAVSQNQPYEVSLDGTELNSYLRSNLQTSGVPLAAESTESAAADLGGSNSPLISPEAPAAQGEPSLAEVQSSVRDVQVDLVGDLVEAYVVFNFHGKDLSLELDGHLSSAGGYLQFQPTAGFLGSLPLPQSALDSAVQKMMSSPENREKLRLPPGINGIRISDGQLVVDYQ